MRVVDLLADDEARVRGAAEALVAAFADQVAARGWGTLEQALAEVRASFGAGHLSLVALDAAGQVLGWVGGIRYYDGVTWELHPLAVHPAAQRRGVGRALVGTLEERVRAGGGRNVWLTTDIDPARTGLAAGDLYPDVLAALQALPAGGLQQVDFYRRIGYALTGCIPDAYAPGHHELVLARRL